MQRRFANPSNGHTETVGYGSLVLTLLLGPFFLLARRAVLAAVLTTLFGSILIGLGFLAGAVVAKGVNDAGNPGHLFALAVWLAWGMAMQWLLASAYLKRGWNEVPAR